MRAVGRDVLVDDAALRVEETVHHRVHALVQRALHLIGAEEPFQHDAAFLNLARVMTDAMDRKMESEAIVPLLGDSVWTLTGLKPANVATIRLIAEMNHGEVVTLFFPQLRHAA